MAKMEKLEPRALRVPDFLRSYGIGRTKLYELIKNGEIKTILIGKRRLIPRDEAERIINVERPHD
jgi:excisionase family DNA binding protein